MKIKLILLFFSAIMLISCKDNETQKIDTAKEAQKNELIFANLEKHWNLTPPQHSPTVENIIRNWSEWRLFVTEIQQKPKSSIGAFQQKARTMTTRVNNLTNNIPAMFNTPSINSRIMTLGTKVKSLDLYINLHQIPEDKVLKLIPEINQEMNSLSLQMEEIITKSQIKLEEGEAEMIQSLARKRDSLAKPQLKPSVSNQNNIKRKEQGFIPTLNPKATKQ
ncbi:hypothetical protein GV828_07285 [Flavobacterium sp. NST-5]|uniref:Lipoprotein n=1 Tax=Flavobacterium ichthyis TaxID=2698827 RepID=A0ABW9ZA53_9FLAO|nr:hypothetical protein [Flavobacterium ichthyis]NBL65000.1 hypothetical protein [Flavobacterium ichthyis]